MVGFILVAPYESSTLVKRSFHSLEFNGQVCIFCIYSFIYSNIEMGLGIVALKLGKNLVAVVIRNFPISNALTPVMVRPVSRKFARGILFEIKRSIGAAPVQYQNADTEKNADIFPARSR
jgi:hypothetical protein